VLILATTALLACADSELIVDSGQTDSREAITATKPGGNPSAAVTVIHGAGFTRTVGETAGALWEAILPDAWNGDLVMLMQGTTSPELPPTLRNPFQWQVEPAIDGLLARGYGVALSSYRKTGGAIVEGALDTRIAEAAFTSQFGRPNATYLWGWSMGGSVGHQLLEKGANRYAGFLSICSDQVGPTTHLQYKLDAWAIFNYYFPGALPWSLGSGDADLFAEVLPAIQNAFIADPPGFIDSVNRMASIDQLQLPLGAGTPMEYILTVLGSTLAIAGGGADLIETFRGLPVGNVGRLYTSGLLSPQELADLNANVARYAADPGASPSTARLNSTGRTHGTPILALHTDGDAVVPVWMPRMYEEVAEAAGEGDRYVLRVIPAFAHCELTPDLQPDGFADIQMQAFDDLVAWVQNGVKPAS
jgi:pimeloyl-ACP methyl ester carboxylesterase